MNKDTVLTATGLYYSVINHLIGQEINSEGKLNASLHSDSAEIDFGKPGKNNERCNMIKINGTACCSSLKYLQGVNIYQQSVKRHRIAAIRATLERGTPRPDGCELVLFFSPESIIMTHALMSEHSTDAWECFIKQQILFKHFLYVSLRCAHEALLMMNYAFLSRALCPVL